MNGVSIGLLGLAMGSFVNALVWRLHEQGIKSRKSKVESRKYSILRGRSMCPDCKHSLAWYDLLPVISWLSLIGKCRYCHKPISWQYPLVELTTASLFVFSYVFWPSTLVSHFSFLFPFWLAFLVGFMALAVYDFRWMILPDRIIKPLLLIAVTYLIAAAYLGTGLNVLWDAALGVLCSAGLFYLLYQVSRGKWIGGGDVKLAVVLGLLAGSAGYAVLMVFIASCLGSLVAIPLLLAGKAKQNTKLPFGPFLMMATVIVYLFGAALAEWYKNQFLLL